MYIEGIVKNDGSIRQITGDDPLWFESTCVRSYAFDMLTEARVFDPDIVKWGVTLDGEDWEYGVNFAHCFTWDFGFLLIDGADPVDIDPELSALITDYCNSQTED